jgi:5-methylcytosine-specific restriction endonuclease McrA
MPRESIRGKPHRVRLDADAYHTLRRNILERDGWRCQKCGARTNLEVHHGQFRSHQGDDSEDNLITVCHSCHRTIHG